MSTANTPTARPRYTVPALVRAHALLRVLGSDGPATLSEVSRRAQVPKTTTLQLLDTMIMLGWIERAAQSKYRLGIGLYHLGMASAQHRDLREIAAPFMHQLVAETGLACHLAVYQDGETVLVEKVEGPGFIKFDTRIGQRSPLHLTAMGRVLSAYLPPEELERRLRQRGMVKRTSRTVTDPDRFTTLVAEVRSRGFALEDEEEEPGVRCVGAPLRDLSGQVVAAISVTAVVAELPLQRVPVVADQVMATARRISQQLGFRPSD